MRDYMPRIDGLTDLTSVLLFVREVCINHGVKRQSYHFSPIFDEPNSIRTVVYADGFSQEWLKLYERADFRSLDPVPARTFEHGSLLAWRDAMTRWPNTPEQEEFFKAMREHGLRDGFGLPLFGPRGRTAYASIDFGMPLDDVDPTSVGLVRALAQGAHQRLCNLIDDVRSPPDLSDREKQVLLWLARSKSTTDIGTILDLSPETVRTYCQRIYQKLGVSDRLGAVIRALKLGLVRI